MRSLYVEWADANAAFYRTRYYVDDAFDGVTMVNALAALSNGGIQEYACGGSTVIVNAVATDAQYATMQQIMQITYGTSGGGEAVRVYVPSPKRADFLSDGVRGDPSQLATLDAVVFAHILTRGGNAITLRSSAVLTNRRSDQQ